MNDLFVSTEEFLRDFQIDGKQLMWFLGAGASRSANLPTASDLTWDLKKRLFCAKENQSFDAYDINSEAVKMRIQGYMEALGYPHLWSDEEYSFYFELSFKDDYQKQQRYIEWALNPNRVSLNIGHRVFAALIRMELIKAVFTTNFDTVVEQAYSKVAASNLDAFNIEGSYAALDALNNESFPIYAKLHGDFRYRSIKNLSEDLQANDQELKKCFLASACRFGMVVSGYSGRDKNVMSMLEEALGAVNAFPKGIFWTVPNTKYVEENAVQFIRKAREKRIKASLVEAGTFDELLSKVWRQTLNKPNNLVEAVRLHSQNSVSIPLPPTGNKVPVLRTNMLPITELKLKCGVFKFNQGLTFSDLNNGAKTLDYRVVFTYTDEMLYWGNSNEAIKIIPNYRQLDIESSNAEISISDIKSSSFIKGFVEEGILDTISQNTHGVGLRKSGKLSYLVINEKYADSERFQVLRNAVGLNRPESVAGMLNNGQTVWSECVEIGLEVNGNDIYLYLRPDIWIKPKSERDQYFEFLKNKRKNRYNRTTYNILDAWIEILFGGKRGSFRLANPKGLDFSPCFEISTRTAFSRRG